MKSIRPRSGRERSLLRPYLWVFEVSIERGKADAFETVRFEDAEGRFLTYGAWRSGSLIRVHQRRHV